MEATDIETDHVEIGRPPLLELRLVRSEADSRHVVDEGIEPDIHGVPRLSRPRNPPLEIPSARHADVFQAALEPAKHLVAAGVREREVSILRVQILKRLLVLRAGRLPHS